MLFLPEVSWEVPPKATTNANSTVAARASSAVLSRTGAATAQERQLTLAAENSPIRILYGRNVVGGRILNVVQSSSYWYIQSIWSEGEIDSVVAVYGANDTVIPATDCHHYLGTPGQGVDSWLSAAFAANGVSYTDTLPNIAYSVIRIGVSDTSFNFNVKGDVKGLKVYDDRTGLTTFSSCPTLQLADFIRNTRYGKGDTTNSASVVACANANDELVSGLPRRTCGIVIDSVRPADEWVETMASHAAVFLNKEGNEYLLIPDRPAASVFHFQHSLGHIRQLSNLKRRSWLNSPNVTRVRYTDTNAIPWRDRIVEKISAAAAAGTVPWQDVTVSMPGIQNYAEANREAIERHNKTSVSDLSFDLTVFDVGIKFRKGDVVLVSHPIGLTAKGMRVVGVAGALGRYVLSLVEYDPAGYSDSVVTGPTTPDTSLPDPGSPTPVASVTLIEEPFQLQAGSWSSRIRATWPASIFPWVSEYRMNVYEASQLIESTGVRRDVLSWATREVVEGKSYTVEVLVVSKLGASSAPTSSILTALGKYMIPGDVPWVTGFEVGGEVRLQWGAATDKDIWRYEIRWGAVGVSWEDAKALDQRDALRIESKEIPAGTWDFLVCAIDSVKQYSANPARKTLTVTLDSAAFLVDKYDHSVASMTNVKSFTLARTDTNVYYVSDDGVPAATKFPGANLSAYTGIVASYTSGASSLVTDSHDYGQSMTGNWKADVESLSAVSGTVQDTLDLSSDNTNFTPYPDNTAKAEARYSRVTVSSPAGSCFRLTMPRITTRIDAVPREETAKATTLASGGVLVQLNGEYNVVKSLQITPNTALPRTTTFDRILVAPVDGLQFNSEALGDGSGDSYAYAQFSDLARLLQADDKLEFDIYVVKKPVGAFSNDIGIIVRNTDATYTTAYPVHTVGAWVSYSIALTAGKTTSSWELIRESNVPGEYVVVYRNIRVTDGAGTVRQSVWTAGEPYPLSPTNPVLYSALSQNIARGPANSFLAYAFDSSGTQQATQVSCLFKGL